MIPVSNKTRSVTRVGYKHPGFWRQENTITILILSRASAGNGFATQDSDFLTGRSESATENSADLACAARITILIVGSWHSPTSLCVNHNEQQPSVPHCVVPVGTKHPIRRSGFERAIRRRVLRAAVKLDALSVVRVLDNFRAPKDT